MALEPIVESLDAVPQEVHGHYKEVDGKGYVLDVTPKNGYALEDIQSLKTTLNKERSLAKDYEKKLKSYGDLDVDSIKAMQEELEAFRANNPKDMAEAQVKAATEKLVKGHTKVIAEKEELANRYKSQLQQLLVDDNVKNAILAAGGDERTIRFLAPAVKNMVQVTERDGMFQATVLDSNGYPSLETDGSPTSISKLIQQMKNEDKDVLSLFPGRNISGGGKPTEGHNGGMPATSQQPKQSNSLLERAQQAKQRILEGKK